MRVAKLLIALTVAMSLLTLPATALGGPYATEPLLSRAERVKLASSLETGLLRLQSELPTLSPAEKAWLERERRESLDSEGKVTRRYIDLMNTREWALDQVAEPIRTVRAALIRIAASDISLDEEIVHWSIVSVNVADFGFWQHIQALIDMNVLDKDAVKTIVPLNTRELMAANGTLRSREIMDGIVIPVLNSRVR
jgi:hypothetical protein